MNTFERDLKIGKIHENIILKRIKNKYHCY